ncbi:acyltransferase [Bacterioplanoides sp. SCSIO 12839]|uniref:acyltransferase family protein n=1 Tax=Bacterioplanoides sp. SCSIO 12839 TaxID=2829569 RepID=UPI0021042EAF|nr:acyltransferase [Bacterioplanoides sp. SCSIO 12839]UTW48829.1 acyltransferase [Bacterioplanoides sp. SCSIO 12839]
MKSQNTNYLPAVDQIRGIAALLILFYHGLTLISYQLIHEKPFTFSHWLSASSPISAILVEGHTAVSLFMVLSGFIFTAGTYKSKINYRKFLYNRFLRTYPLFMVVLFIGISTHPNSFNVLGFLQTILFMANYPGAINAGNFTPMFWTVAVEWQFYLIFPIILLFTNSYGGRYLTGLIFLTIALRFIAIANNGDIYNITYLTLLGRIDQFLIGILLGIIYIKKFKEGKIANGLFITSTSLIFLFAYAFNQLGGWPLNHPARVIAPTIEAILWSSFIYGYLSFNKKLPSIITSPLASVGLISYSIYLLHFIFIGLCIDHNIIFEIFEDRHIINSIITTAIVVFPSTIIFSALTYNYIEKPFLGIRIKYKEE